MSGDVQATFAATLVDEWVRGGVVHAVVSPGSRSTPLALALAADERVALDVHLDERSAAFSALGIGLATGVPAVLLCTSGTAAANLHPAVVEAHQARVPLLVVTADRPPELQAFGAPQTIDQTHLYGGAVRWFAEPGVAEAATAATWRSLAARAVLEATGSPAGPVHLNLAFRDPLVGVPGPLPEGRPGDAPWHRRLEPAAPDAEGVAALAAALAGRRGVVLAGGGAGSDPDAVTALAAALGWPVLADPRSGCRVPAPTTVAAADALLRHAGFAAGHRPEVVLRLGSPPASKVVGSWLPDAGPRTFVVERDGAWLDPDRGSELVVAGDPGRWARALLGTVPAEPVDGGAWLGSWARAEAAAQAAIAATVSGGSALEPAVARTVAGCLPDGATLFVSSSMPVRDLEWYAAPRTGLRVLANRGANGIDGVLSTAVGVAAAAARNGGGHTAVLIGDLAFLHDANGLLGLAVRDLDLTIVVVDNRGGGIFSFLPQRRDVAPERFEQLFGTPQGVDVAELAAVHGLPAVTVHDLALLGGTVAGLVRAPGTQVVVVPSDRAANVAEHDHLHAAVHAALDRSAADA
jgi:2-succinyl-5-enolpyruvyl-6-hydroxy-3-cyclohexene-1-carboxylate synthase